MNLFVYGTLKPNHSNWQVLAPLAKSQPQAATIPENAGMALVSASHGAYPYMVHAQTTGLTATIIHGHVVQVEPASIHHLDAFEGVPTHYERMTLAVFIDEEQRQAECYVAADPCEEQLGDQIVDGIWKL